MLIPVWIATSIVYLVVGLEGTLSNWLLYCNVLFNNEEFIFTLTAVCGYLIGIVAGVLCK